MTYGSFFNLLQSEKHKSELQMNHHGLKDNSKQQPIFMFVYNIQGRITF